MHKQLDLVQFPFGRKIKFSQNDLQQCICLESQGNNFKISTSSQ